jgi:hypothetical protein
MTPTRYSGTVNAYEWLASELRKRGVQASTDQLEVRAAAIRERKRLDATAAVGHVKDLAVAVKKAKRAAEVAESLWRLSPTAGRRKAVADAYATRSEAKAELLEACCQDQSLYAAVLRSVS